MTFGAVTLFILTLLFTFGAILLKYLNGNFNNRCYQNGNKTKHNFESKVTTESTPVLAEFVNKLTHLKGYGLSEIIESLKSEVYHGDVCKWCGKIVNRKNIL